MGDNSTGASKPTTETKIPGFRKTSYHPLARVGGFVAALFGVWLIAQDVLALTSIGATLTLRELFATLVLAVFVVLMIVMFVFEVAPEL
jgi:hypothetical protein